MRRRLMGGVSIKATLVSQMDAIAGDVCFYNSETDSKEFYRLDVGDDQIPTTCTPIGVVVIPASHDVYGDGDCAIMSLKLPAESQVIENNVGYTKWSSVSFDTALSNYSGVVTVGSQNNISASATGISSSPTILPGSNPSWRVPNIWDTDTYYYSNTSAYQYAPSPYNEDDSRNNVYYQTSSPSSIGNALSDFNGKNNCNSMSQELEDLDSAMYYCSIFHTKGTSTNDWYLPALGELGYIVPKFSTLQKTIQILNNIYTTNYPDINDAYYWSSTECNSSQAYYLTTSTGKVDSAGKTGYMGVRAFHRVPAPIKYGPIQLTGGSVSDIPASGGTSGAPTGYTYTQTWGHSGSTTNGGVITSGAEISYTTVTADSLGTTITNRAKVGDSVLTITMNGVTQDFNIPVYQKANRVTSILSKIDSFSYSGQAAASGGNSTPTTSTSYVIGYTSNASSTSAPTSGTLTQSISYSLRNAQGGESLDYTTGKVTWANRTTAIGAARSTVIQIANYYTYTHSSTYGGASVTSNAHNTSASYGQAANLITAVEANSNNFSYSNISAGATSATPTTNHAPKYTFSSGSTSTTTPDTTYGSLTTSVTYTMANNTTNGFTACNSSTGVLTATNRGTTIGNARTSANVVKSLTYTWKHSSTYGSGSVSSGNITKSATCTQEGNYVTDITSTAASLSYPNIGAGATSASPLYDFGDVQYTFSSGSTSTTNPGTTYGTYSGTLKYSLAASQNGFTSVNTTSGVLTATNRSTTIGNARASATVTCTLSMSWTPTSTYNAAGTKTATRTATATCTQNGNYVTAVTPSATSGYSSHFTYDSNIGAGGGTVSPTGRGQATYTFSSGATTTSGSVSWTNAGTTTFSRTYSGTLATGFTSIDSSSGAVTASSRGTTQGGARSQSVSSTLTVTFTHNSTYSAGGTKSGTLTQSATCTQSANNSSMTSVRIVAYQPDNTWLATNSWGSIPAGGHYLGVYGYYGYTWSSGSTSETAVGNLKTGLTYTTSMAEVHTNGGLHVLSRGTSYSASTRSGTVYWTYNGLKSNTLSFTQNANTITITSVTSSPGSLTGATFAAGGQTKDITASAASASAVLTYSSGSTVTINYNNTTYGTWTFHGYTGSSNQTYAVVNSTNYDKMSISMGNNTSTAARSATITRKEAGFTFTLNSTYGGASKKSTGTQCTCTVTQSAGAKQYGSWTGGAVTFNSTSALSAGADSRTVTIAPWTRTWGWNSTSGGGTETYTGSVTLSENGSYTSLNTTSYTASSSSKSVTLTKSTCGTTIVAATTVTVTAVGPTTTTGSLSQNANAKTSITYGTPSVSLSYSGNASAAASTKSPTYSYSQSRTQNYSSTATEDLSNVTSGGSLSFSETTTHSAATVNSSTGVVSWSANTSTSSRSCGVTLTVTLNGKSGSKAATCTQNGDSISSSSTTYTISFSASPTSVGVGGGTVTLSYSGTSTTTNYWVSGDQTTSSSTFTPSISGSATGFSRSGTTVTVSSNGGTSSSRSVTYTASYSGATSKTVTITQSGDTTTPVTTTEHSYECSLTASTTTVSSLGGTVTLYPSAIHKTRTKTDQKWVYAGTIASTGSWSNWSSTDESSNTSRYTISGSATGFSRSGNTVTVSSNTSTSSRSCTYTMSYQGAVKKSVTITQSGAPANRAFDLVINDHNAMGWICVPFQFIDGIHISDTGYTFHYGGSAETHYESELPLYIYANMGDGYIYEHTRITSYPSSAQFQVDIW